MLPPTLISPLLRACIKLGYFLYFAATPWGKMLFIVIPLLILLLMEVASLALDFKKPHEPDKFAPHDSPYPA